MRDSRGLLTSCTTLNLCLNSTVSALTVFILIKNVDTRASSQQYLESKVIINKGSRFFFGNSSSDLLTLSNGVVEVMGETQSTYIGASY